MIAFWLIAAALAAGALAWVLPPFIRRQGGQRLSRSEANVSIYKDQLRELDAELAAGTLSPDDHARARLELEARLLEDVPAAELERATGSGRRAALAVGIAVPLLALAVYLATGTPGALDPRQAMPTAAQVDGMVARLAAKLRENPDDADGWKLLGRSYAVMGRFSESSEAYAKAVARAPKDAQLLADYADSLAMAQGRTLKGEPEKILKRALAADPNNVKALVLAGTAAFDRGDKAGAVQLWERALAVVPAESQMAERLRAGIAEARGSSPIAQAPKAAKAAAKSARVSGTVKVDPKLAGKIAPDDTVFIFARAAEGPRMPLAILRKQGRDLPLQFTLDDSMAMAPQMNLSAFPRVVIGARVSKSANASAQPGDLQGASAPIAVGSERVDVTIDTEVR